MNQRDPIGLYKDIPEKKPEDSITVDNATASNSSITTNGDSWTEIREGQKTNSSWDRIRIGNNQTTKASSRYSPFDAFEEEEVDKADTKIPVQVPVLPTQTSVMDRTISQEEFDELLENERNND